MKKAISCGLLASLFFAFTFIFNRSMNLGGGYWLWGAALRYIFMLPLLMIIVWSRHGLGKIHNEIRHQPLKWICWSTVGFGFFYMPLSMASVYGESWFVAATWQVTIVAGVLLTPLFGKRIPLRNLAFSAVILAGIFILQFSRTDPVQTEGMLTALMLIVAAGFAYPLGNRKMMGIVSPGITTLQRVYGMTLCSLPFWLVCAVYAYVTHGCPGAGQAVQSLIVAVFSGVVATLLFFEATNLVRTDPRRLAIVEATQAGEVLFTLLGGIIFLGDAVPNAVGFLGIFIIVAGMTANSLSG